MLLTKLLFHDTVPRAPPVRHVEAPPLPGMEYWLAPRAKPPTVNVLTIDLEDWPVAVLGPEHEITGRVVENTKRCLQILRWHYVKATFFVLGRVAERFPSLVREVHAAGHEIASHGYGHRLLTRMSPRSFQRDVRRSIEILTDIVGERPIGYRAPGFSIVESTRWAGP
ncbi:MAG: polysaccharide deacetylase family protein, partial [Phycisphaerae bacterium]|nr:polysaccharide deacetylase family protein [Phycisphaerae bacterium]